MAGGDVATDMSSLRRCFFLWLDVFPGGVGEVLSGYTAGWGSLGVALGGAFLLDLFESVVALETCAGLATGFVDLTEPAVTLATVAGLVTDFIDLGGSLVLGTGWGASKGGTAFDFPLLALALVAAFFLAAS